MPPAMSDYGSDDDTNLVDTVDSIEKYVRQLDSPKSLSAERDLSCSSSTIPSHKSKNSFPRATSTTKKRSALLAGLEPDNIIQPDDDNPPESSIPTSSYSLRTQVRGSQRSELCYNQRYHPIDDFTRPKRAARMKIKYGQQPFGSDSSVSTFKGGRDESDEESDGDDVQDTVQSRFVPPPSAQPLRRASRKVNRKVAYNMNVHPQDNEILAIEDAEQNGSGSRKRTRYEVEDTESGEDSDVENSVEDSDSEEVNEKQGGHQQQDSHLEESHKHHIEISDTSSIHSESESESEVDEENGDAKNGNEHHDSGFHEGVHDESPNVVGDEENNTEAQTAGGDGRDSVHGSTRKPADRRFYPFAIMPPNSNDVFPFPGRFRIHQESVEDQVAAVAAAPAPVTVFTDNDQENNVPEEEEAPDPLAGITVHTAAEIAAMDHEPDWSQYVHNGDDSDDDSTIGRRTPLADITEIENRNTAEAENRNAGIRDSVHLGLASPRF